MQGFVHLHGHTEYSLFDGLSRISQLVSRVKELGQSAVAITDHGVMYGAIYLYKEAKKQGIHPIIGCEMYVTERNLEDRDMTNREKLRHLILLAENEEGYRNLSKLDSIANTIGFYRKPRINREVLARHSRGLIALSACINGELPQWLLAGNEEKARETIEWYIQTFGRDSYFIELQDHGIPEEREVRSQLIALAREYGVGLVATNDFHYVRAEDVGAANVRVCISTNQTLDNQHFHPFERNEFYVKSTEEMASLFADVPEALENTVRIAERCQVEFRFGEHHLPAFHVPDGYTAESYLRELCEKALPRRYQEVTPEVRERLAYELGIIERMGFSDYFLITMDFIDYARRNGIAVGPGRGSAAGSIVAYLLGITGLDPLQYGLLFERFLNPERISMPDIDTDLCYKGRGRVIEYLSRRYGEEHVAQIITFGTMAARAVVRDVGRVMNVAYKDVDRIAKLIPGGPGVTLADTLAHVQEFKELYDADSQVRQLIDYALRLEGLSRHAGTHAAGLVISREPVSEYVPLQKSADDYLQTQYEKDTVEELGLLKMDLLGLRNLTVIQETVDLVRQSRGIEIDPGALPTTDEKTCEMLCAGDTVGVFQSESSGFTALLKQLKPTRFEDLIPMVALYRPGPLGSGMAEDFIKRRHGQIPVVYDHPLLEPILKETFGVILYQEQVMQIASVMGGFTLGKADELRRAMGKKKEDVLLAQRDAFLAGAAARHVPTEVANRVFDNMVYFAGYGFNKSHSVCYGYIAWQTAYLKAHYRPEFMAAMMSSYKENTDKLSHYLADCRLHGIAVMGPDINHSGTDFTVEEGRIRFGLSAIRNVGEGLAEAIIQARDALYREQESSGAPVSGFSSLVELTTRVVLNKRALESLIKAGAIDSVGIREGSSVHRAQLFEVAAEAIRLGAIERDSQQSMQVGLFDDIPVEAVSLSLPNMPPWDLSEVLAAEKEMLGFFVSGHPLAKYEQIMTGLTSILQLQSEAERYDGKRVCIGGTVTALRRLLTKRNDQMGFVTVEDLDASIEVVIFPKLWPEARSLLAEDAAVVIDGRVQADERETKVIANKVYPMELVAAGEVVLPPGQEVYRTSPEVRMVPENPAKEPETDIPAERISRLYLVVDEAHEGVSVSERLGVILASYKGEIPITLKVERTGAEIVMDRRFHVDGSPELVRELRKLLGDGQVRTEEKG